MAEEVQNLWVGGFNPSLYKLLVNSFEKYWAISYSANLCSKEFKTEVTLNQSEGTTYERICELQEWESIS